MGEERGGESGGRGVGVGQVVVARLKMGSVLQEMGASSVEMGPLANSGGPDRR